MKSSVVLIGQVLVMVCCSSLSFGADAVCGDFEKSPVYSTDIFAKVGEMEKKAVQCNTSPIFHFNYGYLLERLGRYEQALAQYKVAIALDPDSAQYSIGMADVLRAMGKRDAAIRYYQLALVQGSQDKRVQKRLVALGVGAQASSFGAGSPGASKNMIWEGEFYVDRQEVSVAEFQSFRSDYVPPEGYTSSMPATNMSFDDAREYAASQGKRLCSSQEWQGAVAKASPDLQQMNLYKEYHSIPYSVDFGPQKDGVQNLIGNVAEWVETDKGPGFIGGHYHSGTLLQAEMDDLSRVVTAKDGGGKVYVGLRLCMDASPEQRQAAMEAEQKEHNTSQDPGC